MFKGFPNNNFRGFPNLSLQSNREAYGFSGLTWQFDPRYNLSSQVNGDLISYWVDRVRGKRFIQATGSSQPIFVQSNALYNNNPTLNFSTDAKNLVCQEGYLEWGQARTIYAVANYSTINQFNTLLHTPGNFTRLNFGGTYSASVTGIGVYNIDTGYFISTIEDTNPHIVVITPTKLIVDGVHISSGIITVPTVVKNIGGESTIGFTGHVAEIGAFVGDFTAAQAIDLCDRLNQKHVIY